MAREIVIRGRAVTTHSSNVVDTKSRRREFRQGELAVSDTAVTENRAARLGRPYGAVATWEAPDTRRVLQLGLSGLWLLDAILQYQSFMFTRAFGQMLTASAAGNPAVVGRPITWAARLVEQHGGPLNTTFATAQLLLALGIAWRPTLKA